MPADNRYFFIFPGPLSIKCDSMSEKTIEVTTIPNATSQADVYRVETLPDSTPVCWVSATDTPPLKCTAGNLKPGTEYHLGSKACFKISVSETCSRPTENRGWTLPSGMALRQVSGTKDKLVN